MSSKGKRYEAAKAQIDPEGNYRPLDAFRLLVSQEVARFDTTVEAHFRLGVNVRHAEEQLRGTIALPHGTGREVTVAVFAEGEKAREAEEAGANVVQIYTGLIYRGPALVSEVAQALKQHRR
jgi:large subunit ribosomal protein L1